MSTRRQEIARAARELQLAMWNDRSRLLPGRATIGHFDVLHSKLAAKFLGLNYEEHESLGQFGHRGDRFEVAGLINANDKLIAISRHFKIPTRRFTAAHEIGHYVLHPHLATAHRDRPVSSARPDSARTPMERDADYFAACFLIPGPLLARELKKTFDLDTLPFVINDAEAFHLSLDRRRETQALHAATAVASAKSYQGRHFDSIANKFGVSIAAMAYRLDELKFVQD